VHRTAGTGSLPHVEWGFIWIMLVLKIPLIALLWLVWWAIKNVDEPDADPATGDGGTKVPHPPRPRRRGRWPRRGGPHGTPVALPPPRVRTTTARARDADHPHSHQP